MQMRGVVVYHEHHHGLIAIHDDRDEFAVVELVGGQVVERGDVISGDIENHGSQTLMNETKNEQINVLIQGIGMTETQVIQMLQNTH
jgi:hypothetical protein